MAGRRLLGEDGKFIKNKASSVFTVLQANTKVYDQLVTSEVKKVGFNGKNSSDIAAANATKDAEKDRIKTLDAAHYSLSGKAAREQQGLSWYQPLDISTVGGNTRNKGGIDADGDYLNQEVMSFDTPENFTGKMITTNLRSAKNIELFGDSVNALNEINQGADSESLRLSKDLERTTNAIVAGESASQADNFFIETTKSNIIFEDSLDAIEDERSLIEKAGDMVDDLTKPVADFVSKKIVELHDTTILKPIVSHLVDSVNAADQSLDRFTDNVSDIGKGFVDFGLGYVDAVKSIGTAINTEQDFIRPSEFEDMRHQAIEIELEAEKDAVIVKENTEAGYKQYYGARVIGNKLQTEKELAAATMMATKILSDERAQTNRQAVIDEAEAAAQEKADAAEQIRLLEIEKSKKIAESKRQRIADVKERTSALQRENEDKRQNDLIDGIANKSDEAAAKVAKEKAEKQRKSHDKYQNNRIDNIANESDAAAAAAKARTQTADTLASKLAAQKYQNQINSTTPDDVAGPATKKYPFQTIGRGDGSLHGTDPFRFTSLEYPKKITSDPQYGHYILFYVNVQNKTKYKYLGYNDDGNAAIIGDVVEKQTYTSLTDYGEASGATGSDATQTTSTAPTDRNYRTNYTFTKDAQADPVAYQTARHFNMSGGRGNNLQSNQVTLMRQRKATQGLDSRLNLTSRITDSVAMYLPSEIGNSTATKYEGAETGMLGYLALGGTDLIGQLQNRDYAGMGDTAVSMAGRAITEGLKKTAIAAADAFSGANTQGAIDKVFGQTVNPFIEVAFESMGVRSFDYTFNFTPKSEEETKEVKAIIQLFRFHMVPELKGSNHRYLTLPSTFDIHYMYQATPEESKENTFYNKIATCVLESCDVNYAPGGVKSFDDGAPTQITMKLSFMETEMLTKEKVNKGF